jgi:NDP-sugar pyrophosphorylase family protein
MINIVIPMAGEGSRFKKAGYIKPKPFIDVAGKPMIARVMDNLSLIDAKFILIGRAEHMAAEKETVAWIKSEYRAEIIEIDQLTEGTACTVLFAREAINTDDPLLIANSDQIVDLVINDYIDDCKDRNLDGSILCFDDPTLNPKWSFAKINADTGLVTEVREKEAISQHATVGIYYFSRGKYFVDGAIDMIVRNDRVNGEFYTCPVYNYAIKQGAKIGIHSIDATAMHGLGIPEDLNGYLRKIG